MHDGHLIFEWTPGQEITDGEEQHENEIGNNLIDNITYGNEEFEEIEEPLEEEKVSTKEEEEEEEEGNVNNIGSAEAVEES